MVPPFDIFRVGADRSVVWLEAAADLEIAQARVKVLAPLAPGEYLIFSQKTGHQISIKASGKRMIFQIGYDDRQGKARAQMLRYLGYEVSSAADNPAAKLELMTSRHVDLFVVGDLAPEETRREMVRWLKTNYPKVKILALQPSGPSQVPMQDADYTVMANDSNDWLGMIARAVG
jgi:CheY-like chemotaxis protein